MWRRCGTIASVANTFRSQMVSPMLLWSSHSHASIHKSSCCAEVLCPPQWLPNSRCLFPPFPLGAALICLSSHKGCTRHKAVQLLWGAQATTWESLTCGGPGPFGCLPSIALWVTLRTPFSSHQADAALLGAAMVPF